MPEEQLSLVRFRMKKTCRSTSSRRLSAITPQAGQARARRMSLLRSAALEIVARYEAAFRSAGLHPGHVTTAAASTVELMATSGISVLARLSGRYLSVLVTNGQCAKARAYGGAAGRIRGRSTRSAVSDACLCRGRDGLSAPTVFTSVGFDAAGRIPEWVS